MPGDVAGLQDPGRGLTNRQPLTPVYLRDPEGRHHDDIDLEAVPISQALI